MNKTIIFKILITFAVLMLQVEAKNAHIYIFFPVAIAIIAYIWFFHKPNKD